MSTPARGSRRVAVSRSISHRSPTRIILPSTWIGVCGPHDSDASATEVFAVDGFGDAVRGCESCRSQDVPRGPGGSSCRSACRANAWGRCATVALLATQRLDDRAGTRIFESRNA
jgi:hypothetical protein